MNLYVGVSLALSLYFLVAWLAGSLLGLRGSDLWILRGALALIGIIAAVAYLWYQLRSAGGQRGRGRGGARKGARAPETEIDLVIREAAARLAASELGRKAKPANFPVIILAGKEGSTKTSSMIHSGLEPELLAGQVFQESTVVPTRTANLWYAQRTVFVEAGGKLLAQPRQWSRLLRKLRPGTLRSLLPGREEAPRAALVCLSCEEFLKPGAAEGLSATARDLRARLEEASRTFGVRLPVYVLFTKTDRMAFFAEYVRNLSTEEAGQVLGVTLPVEADETAGVYAERQERRLTEAFNNLYFSLCDRRPELLAREHDPEKLPGAYEFPRELRKFRPALVQLLVDLCRPSQLRAGPFLRGFYFSGVRAVITQELPAQAPRRQVEERPGYGHVSGATMAFRAGQPLGAPEPAVPQAGAARKVPQWVFLSRFFTGVLLADSATMGAGASLKTSRMRRILLAAAVVLCVIWTIGLIVSYRGNRALESEVLEAARGIRPSEAAGADLASLTALSQLDDLRQSLETLTRYEQEGPPWRLRWGLYAGHDLYPNLRRAYYSRFHQLLLSSTQVNLVDTLQRLPAKPSPTDEYGAVYDALKAYLITTSHSDRSTRLFLAPVLLRHWVHGREVDPDRAGLAQKQFDFYSEDVKISNPFSSEHDALAVERGRRYLSQFAGVERVYRFMLAEASKENPTVNFNRQFPGSASYVSNIREVSGAFTKGGWAFMQDAVKNADRFFTGEEWVLGEQAPSRLDRAELEQHLKQRYTSDFVSAWREFLKATSVIRYGSLGDAARKLNVLSGNQSPLLGVFWVATQNTAVESEEVQQAFQPVHAVVSVESEDRYISDSNAGYMNALVGLQASLEQAANTPAAARDPLVAQIITQATNAKVVTRQAAQKFRIDPEAQLERTVQRLMEAPILYAEALVRSLGPAELNAKGKALCARFGELMTKYPFRAEATAQATLPEVAAIFQPGSGALWTFYEEDLREHLARQESGYAPVPGSSISLNPAFVSFFNKAASFTEAVYPDGSADPRLAYRLRGQPPEGMRSLNLTINDQTLTTSGGRMTVMGFVWPGSGAPQVRLTGKFGGGTELAFSTYEGPWAVFQFFGDADRWQEAGTVHRLEWVLRQGRAGRPLTLPDGRPLTVRFDLETPIPVFRKDFLAGMECVSRVVR